MPLGRYDRASQERIHEKVHDCVLWNIRTGVGSKALSEKLTRTLFDTNLTNHSTFTILATPDSWVEGDTFYVTRQEYPNKKSSVRLVKFIETKEIGYAVRVITILGTIDL